MLEQLAYLVQHVTDQRKEAIKARVVPLLTCGCSDCIRYYMARALLLKVFA